MSLRYPPFAASERVKNAAQNRPAMRRGEKGFGVELLQTALLDLGYKMPISTRKTGSPDGSFGKETYDCVLAFQTKNKLGKDGVAGAKTFGKLDDELVLKNGHSPKPSPPVAPSPPPIVIPPTRDYKIGSDDPKIKPDFGSGVWAAKPPERAYRAMKATITNGAFMRAAEEVTGPDAVKQMLHYFGNTGSTFTIDLEKMIAQVDQAKQMFVYELYQAVDFVETLPPGLHQITSRFAESSYNYKSQSTNWYFAVGGYSFWGKGRARSVLSPAGYEYDLLFEYHFFDRYNWDAGKKVEILGIEITDNLMGEFHKQGLAHEYDAVGVVRRHLIWREGQPIPDAQMKIPDPQPGRRQDGRMGTGRDLRSDVRRGPK